MWTFHFQRSNPEAEDGEDDTGNWKRAKTAKTDADDGKGVFVIRQNASRSFNFRRESRIGLVEPLNWKVN